MTLNKSLSTNSLAVYIGITVLVMLLYGYTLSFSYAGDDTALISQNKVVQNGFSSLSDLFTKSTFYGFNKENFGAYRPLTMLSFATEVSIWGNKPALSHFMNLLLYILSGCLLYRLMCLLLKDQYVISLFITLLFLAHPVHTEVVANIKSRDEILAFLFSLLIPLLLLWKSNGNMTKVLLAYVSFFLGLFAKENAVTFCVPIVLALYFFKGKTIKESFYYGLPFIGLVGIYLGIRNILLEPIPATMQSVTNTLFHCQTWSEKVGTIFFMLLSYLRLLLVPIRLSWDHSFSDIPVVSLFKPAALFSMLLHGSLLGYAVWTIKRKTIGSYIILFYFSTLFLFLNVVFPLSQNIAERFLLVPSLAFCMALVLLLNRLSEKLIKGSQTLLYISCSLILVFYGVRSIKRNPVWKNNDTFFASVVKDAPQSFHAHQSLGTYLSAKADDELDANRKMALYTQAKECYERSLAIYPGFQLNWYMLGRCAQLTGDFKQAEHAYLESELQFEKPKIESFYNLAALYKQAGDYKKAIDYFKKANALEENFNGANGLIGECYLQLNQKELAEVFLNKAYAQEPTNRAVLNNLGVLNYTSQHYGKAEKYFKLSLQSDSCFLDGLKNTAASCQVQQKNTEAILYYEKAIRCYPLQENLYSSIVALLYQTGSSSTARGYEAKLNDLKQKGLIK